MSSVVVQLSDAESTDEEVVATTPVNSTKPSASSSSSTPSQTKRGPTLIPIPLGSSTAPKTKGRRGGPGRGHKSQGMRQVEAAKQQKHNEAQLQHRKERQKKLTESSPPIRVVENVCEEPSPPVELSTLWFDLTDIVVGDSPLIPRHEKAFQFLSTPNKVVIFLKAGSINIQLNAAVTHFEHYLSEEPRIIKIDFDLKYLLSNLGILGHENTKKLQNSLPIILLKIKRNSYTERQLADHLERVSSAFSREHVVKSMDQNEAMALDAYIQDCRPTHNTRNSHTLTSAPNPYERHAFVDPDRLDLGDDAANHTRRPPSRGRKKSETGLSPSNEGLTTSRTSSRHKATVSPLEFQPTLSQSFKHKQDDDFEDPFFKSSSSRSKGASTVSPYFSSTRTTRQTRSRVFHFENTSLNPIELDDEVDEDLSAVHKDDAAKSSSPVPKGRASLEDERFPLSFRASDRILLTYPPNDPRAISILELDYFTLRPDEFINDNIINFYLQLIQREKFSEELHKRVFVCNTFFYTSLTKGSKALERLVRNVNLLEKDFVVVPINESAHWYLAIVCYPGLSAEEMKRNVVYREAPKIEQSSSPTVVSPVDDLHPPERCPSLVCTSDEPLHDEPRLPPHGYYLPVEEIDENEPSHLKDMSDEEILSKLGFDASPHSKSTVPNVAPIALHDQEEDVQFVAETASPASFGSRERASKRRKVQMESPSMAGGPVPSSPSAYPLLEKESIDLLSDPEVHEEPSTNTSVSLMLPEMPPDHTLCTLPTESDSSKDPSREPSPVISSRVSRYQRRVSSPPKCQNLQNDMMSASHQIEFKETSSIVQSLETGERPLQSPSSVPLLPDGLVEVRARSPEVKPMDLGESPDLAEKKEDDDPIPLKPEDLVQALTHKEVSTEAQPSSAVFEDPIEHHPPKPQRKYLGSRRRSKGTEPVGISDKENQEEEKEGEKEVPLMEQDSSINSAQGKESGGLPTEPPSSNKPANTSRKRVAAPKPSFYIPKMPVILIFDSLSGNRHAAGRNLSKFFKKLREERNIKEKEVADHLSSTANPNAGILPNESPESRDRVFSPQPSDNKNLDNKMSAESIPESTSPSSSVMCPAPPNGTLDQEPSNIGSHVNGHHSPHDVESKPLFANDDQEMVIVTCSSPQMSTTHQEVAVSLREEGDIADASEAELTLDHSADAKAFSQRIPFLGSIEKDSLPYFFPNAPLQPNSCDCGAFLLLYFEKFLESGFKDSVKEEGKEVLIGPANFSKPECINAYKDWFTSHESDSMRNKIADEIERLAAIDRSTRPAPLLDVPLTPATSPEILHVEAPDTSL